MTGNDEATVPPTKRGLSSRKRKAHTKSRLGCRNCKLRRVKCDETKPACEKCVDFDVVCNYSSDIPDLQPRAAAGKIGYIEATIERSAFSSNGPLLKAINASLDGDTSPPLTTYIPGQFEFLDMARMDRFQTRTVLTIGSKSTSSYFRKDLVRLALSHRFLMHMVQSVTAAHDRFLSGAASSVRTPSELYHMTQAVRALHYKLAHPVRDQDRDALFVSASLLGVLTFNLEASSVEEAWPLGGDDFAWLNMSDGKKAVWAITKPLRADSVWRPMADLYGRRPFERPPAIAKSRSSVFDHLYSDDVDGDDASVTLVNPYRNTAMLLAELLDLECDDSTWTKFLAFIAHVDPPYKMLLQAKDPWAMLMLAYWFVKICRGPWWIATRAILQGQAICLYLERYHADDVRLQEAVRYPRRELGLAHQEGCGGF